MKKFILLLLALVPVVVFSQDMILLKTGVQIKCTVESQNDSTVIFTENTGGTLYRKEMRMPFVQGVYKGYFAQEIMRTPSAYLKRAGNFQTASIMVACVLGGIGMVLGDTPGTIVAAGGGVLALALHIAGNAQLNYAGKALERIKIENGGINITF